MEDSTHPAVPPAIRCCIGFFFFGGGGGCCCCLDEALLLFVFVSVELMVVACDLFFALNLFSTCYTNFCVFSVITQNFA